MPYSFLSVKKKKIKLMVISSKDDHEMEHRSIGCFHDDLSVAPSEHYTKMLIKKHKQVISRQKDRNFYTTLQLPFPISNHLL